jgi:hypothetical protein
MATERNGVLYSTLTANDPIELFTVLMDEHGRLVDNGIENIRSRLCFLTSLSETLEVPSFYLLFPNPITFVHTILGCWIINDGDIFKFTAM